MTRAPKPMYTNQTYGTTEELNRRLRDVDNKEITGRNNNLPPASINTTDQTRTIQPVEEEVAQITGQEGVSPVSNLGQTTNMLDVLRDSDFANEDATAGASPVYVSQTELGDLDYEVLASLSGNTSVNALKEILQQG
tara:strand:+ start:276 stop:686 length:411 start_codon:yes stop_codon:yes gene_type:complete